MVKLDWIVSLFYFGDLVEENFTGSAVENLNAKTSSIVGHGGAGAYLQQFTGGRRGSPWTGRQSIAGQHRHTQDKQPRTHSFTSKGNLERPTDLPVMFLDCGWKLAYSTKTKVQIK
ncbi:hypothetical protein GOODEAATRI_032841 [Goodea atripinnis]|uniref:Uncharacterized protein n=1 Tax=Goodea atripinnis TaxID=208336 RepID=A0ABV0MMM2_9TELE